MQKPEYCRTSGSGHTADTTDKPVEEDVLVNSQQHCCRLPLNYHIMRFFCSGSSRRCRRRDRRRVAAFW